MTKHYRITQRTAFGGGETYYQIEWKRFFFWWWKVAAFRQYRAADEFLTQLMSMDLNNGYEVSRAPNEFLAPEWPEYYGDL